jgi:gas vesicle protein
MKKNMTLLLALILATTGISILAENPVQKDNAECPMGSPQKMRRHMSQLDEIDKLLIMVAAQEKMQAPKMKKHGSRRMMGKNMKGKDGKSCPMKGKESKMCPMKGKESKMCQTECKGGKPCPMKGKAKFRGKRQQRDSFKNKGAFFKAYLLKNYPKEMEEIAAQKKDNDATAKDILARFKKLVDEAKTKIKADREKMKAEREQFAKMVEEYKKSKDEKLAEQIKAKMAEFYDKRLEAMKTKLDEDSSKIQKAYDKLKEKKADKDKEISERFEKITK